MPVHQEANVQVTPPAVETQDEHLSPLATVPEVAELFKVHKSTVRRWALRGIETNGREGIPAIRVGAHRILIPREWLNARLAGVAVSDIEVRLTG